MKSLVLALCVWTLVDAQAATVEKIDFPDDITVGSTKLVFNGGGMRQKEKFWKMWDVYVASLYLTEKSKDAAAIMASEAPKVMELVFVRSLSRKDLQKAWNESFEKVCGADCAAAKEQLGAFNDAMADVNEKDHLKITFEKDGVKVDLKGKKGDKSATVTGEAFRRVLLNIYLSEKTPAPELRPKLLGL